MTDNRHNRFFYIDFIKVIAILLIINSHMDPVYAHKSLATGGALGNALFFLCSGFLIRGKEKNKTFYFKFLTRIYLSVIVVTMILYHPRDEIFRQLVWPTNYWFVGAIILFYVLYDLFERFIGFKHYYITMIGLLLLYVVVYVFVLDTSVWIVEAEGLSDISSAFKLIYYYAIMLTGGFLKEVSFSPKLTLFSRIAFIVSVILMYVLKWLMTKDIFLMHLQFTSQLFTFTFAVFFYISCRNSRIVEMLEKKERLATVLQTISRASLSVYLVQFGAIGLAASRVSYPFSIFVAILAVVGFACILECTIRMVIKLFSGRRLKVEAGK